MSSFRWLNQTKCINSMTSRSVPRVSQTFVPAKHTVSRIRGEDAEVSGKLVIDGSRRQTGQQYNERSYCQTGIKPSINCLFIGPFRAIQSGCD